MDEIEEPPKIKIQPKLEKQIDKIEEGMAAKKPWQMGGEVKAHERPKNSLMEDEVDFQLATKMPIEHTVSW
jgi:U3 small nucleolar RNA-associated protein MPP10